MPSRSVTKTRIRELRATAGITVESIADATGVHKVTVYAWQAGRRLPSLSNARILARLLGCRIDDLFTEDEAES